MNSRNWKWMVPGMWFILAMLLARALLVSDVELVRWLGAACVMAGGLCAIASVGNLLDYRREQSVRMLERRQAAIARTQLAAELEAARGVHPEIARQIIREKKRAWMLRGQGRNDVLFNAPNVTDVFVMNFLEKSSESFVMAKRLLSDGRINRFDSGGGVTEYEMFDDLVKLLSIEGKIHRWSEFSPWEWVKPWGPRSVAEDYRLVMDWDEEEAVSEEAVSEEAVSEK